MVTVELPATSPAVMAAAWITALSNRKITTSELYEFSRWRDDPVNNAAFEALCGVPDLAPKFVAVGKGRHGDVVDIWTGGRAWLAEQVGEKLTTAKARRMANFFNSPQGTRVKE